MMKRQWFTYNCREIECVRNDKRIQSRSLRRLLTFHCCL